MNRLAFLGVAERSIATFLATFLAMWLPVVAAASNTGNWAGLADLSILQKAAVAGGAAVLSLIKSVIATQVGNPNSGGFLPSWLVKMLRAVETPTPPAAQMKKEG